MEQNRNPRDKSTYLWTPYLPQGGKDIQQKTDNLFNEVVKMRFNENKMTTSLMRLSKWFKDLNL